VLLKTWPQISKMLASTVQFSKYGRSHHHPPPTQITVRFMWARMVRDRPRPRPIRIERVLVWSVERDVRPFRTQQRAMPCDGDKRACSNTPEGVRTSAAPACAAQPYRCSIHEPHQASFEPVVGSWPARGLVGAP